MPNTIPGEGTVLEWSDDAGTTWTPVEPLESITPPGTEYAVVEIPDLGATDKRRRASRIRDNQAMEFSFVYDPNDADHIALMAAMDASTTLRWKITYVDDMAVPANETFDGFASENSVEDLEEESNLMRSVTVTITGAITRTPGAAA